MFLANIILLTVIFYSNLYYFFSWQGRSSKGIWNLFLSGYALLVLISTVVWLGSIRQVFRILIILDNFAVVYVITVVGFYGMMAILDNGHWSYLSIKIGFVIQSLSISILFKVMILHMKWSKARIIIYKLCLISNSSMLIALSAYYFSIDFSFTRHHVPSFDDKIQDFIMIYMIGIFGYQYEYYSKISDMDFTANLKYIYQMKDLSFH